ncbi:MAG: hypothetical protein Q8N05_20720, partial [Bacteroidota bacterium]|nr:hypothetical protein [Bacteroidota bacterium]
GFTPGESSFGSTYLIGTVFGIVLGVTPVHPACAGPVLHIAEIGLPGFGSKGVFYPCNYHS